MGAPLASRSALLRTGALSALALTGVLAAPAGASSGPGPFAGYMTHGSSAIHYYDATPPDGACSPSADPVRYTVVLRYAPASDAIDLRAVRETHMGADGTASVTVVAGPCASFWIHLHGMSVANVAPYVVTVTRGTVS